MILASGITNETYHLIEGIAADKARTSTFSYFTSGDIKQEVWIICIKALPKYSESKGKLENYLRRSVENRLKNLKRDRYFRPSKAKKNTSDIDVRINLVNAITLSDNVQDNIFKFFGSHGELGLPCDSLIIKELIVKIYKELPDDLIQDFMSIINGKSVDSMKSIKRKRLYNAIKKIILEDDDG